MTAIIVLDVETTGKDVSRDQVIELCIQSGLGPPMLTETWRIKPSIPIHSEAIAVHGIKDEDLVDCKPFREHAPTIAAELAAADVIVGYNVAFDIDMLQAELERAGMPRLDLAAKQVVDVLRLWHHVEPRTLVAAHEKFCGAPLENAHAAGADVAATGRVLAAMLDRFGLSGRAWPELAAMANPFASRSHWIGPSHHIQWDGPNPVFAFGKNKGLRIDKVDGGFLMWVMGKDFPAHVKDICRAAMQHKGPQLEAWLVEKFPRKQQEAA